MASEILLKVKVWDTSDVIFEGIADRVSSFNEIGTFDVLKMHANFISIIRKKITLYLHGQIIREFDIGQAVIKVKHDDIHIFLGIEAFMMEEESPAK